MDQTVPSGPKEPWATRAGNLQSRLPADAHSDTRLFPRLSRSPLFSVIIATRNRPALFRQALASVLDQSCRDIEIIVVNDGTASECQQGYDSIIGAVHSIHIRSFTLIPRPHGHGGSFARNFGAVEATAPYLCFLDDDDTWTDPNHLNRAQAVITKADTPVDIYMTNQAAFLHDKQQPGPIWIEDLPPILARRGNRPDRHGTHTVTVEELLCSRGFCHLNTLIVRRELYEEVGGLDERNGWEHDRDLYLRLIDRAAVVKYAPITVARHNVPDPTKAANLTTAHSDFERHLSQLRLLDRAIFCSRHAAIRAYGCRHKAYTLKRIAESLAAAGRNAEAAFYAREALGAGPTAKWAAYTAWRTLKQALSGSFLSGS